MNSRYQIMAMESRHWDLHFTKGYIPIQLLNRMVIVARLVILAVFLRYRILNPVHDAIGLWLTSIICEIWFAFSWILDQFPKWFPIDRETYLDRLSVR